METDPVCGAKLSPFRAAGQVEYRGKTFYFCSKACQKIFEEDPEKYDGLDEGGRC